MITMDLNVEFRRFDDSLAKDFARINYEWISQYFEIEELDRQYLDHPKREIIDHGGEIFFALVDNEVVGTVAMLPVDNKIFELSKMGVSAKYKGHKIGKKLMIEAIKFAREHKAEKIYLESNTSLTPAIHLYRSVGFREVKHNVDTPYARCDIKMELEL